MRPGTPRRTILLRHIGNRKSIYPKMLARVRSRCGDPDWAPTGMVSGGGLWFSVRVDEQLTKLYCRLAVKWQAPGWEYRSCCDGRGFLVAKRALWSVGVVDASEPGDTRAPMLAP
jgi:hypothetical protein